MTDSVDEWRTAAYQYARERDEYRGERDAYLELLRVQGARIRAVHRASTLHDAIPGRAPYCSNCRFQWPCPTIRALEGEQS